MAKSKKDRTENEEERLPRKRRRNRPVRTVHRETHLKDSVSSLSIPDDVLRQCSLMTILGNQEITIEGHGGIMDYETDCIRIRAGKEEVAVHGAHLTIDYYNDEELKIIGCIEQISWITHSRRNK